MGEVYFPDNLEEAVPRPVNVGQFSQLYHEVRSGDVIVEDTKTLLINNLHYDGLGPDAFFLVGKGEPNGKGTKVPNENGSLGVLAAYIGQTIRLQLPGDLSVADIDWISIFCIQYTVNFGDIRFPDNLNVPLYYTPKKPSDAPMRNCEVLHERLRVAWDLYAGNLTMEFSSILDSDEYLSFGVNGAKGRLAMIGSRVIVVTYDDRGPMAVDYTMTTYSQCTGTEGVCAVNQLGGINMVDVIEGSHKDGVTRIRVTRPMWSDGDTSLVNEDVDIVWAIGGFQRELDLVTKHDIRIQENKKINFSRPANGDCPALLPVTKTQVAHWSAARISGQDTNVFHATVGPPGGDRGYNAITGRQSWGMAWYINMQLLPELTLRRGDNYTFIIEGGSNASSPGEFHPFYITNSPSGGFGTIREEGQQPDEVIFVGVDEFGHEQMDALGRFCQWRQPAGVLAEEYDTFEDFFLQLKLDCRSGLPGYMTWSPDSNTPDSVYYQCYSHKFMGWKINVVDEYVSTGHKPYQMKACLHSLVVVILFVFLSE